MSLGAFHRDAPIYRQLAEQLSAEIREGYKPGDLLPSEGSLTARFGVNRLTLRRAMEELVSNGLIVRRRGVGAYVLDAAIDYPLQNRTRFTATLAELGHSTDTRILGRQTLRASGGVARALRLPAGEDVLWVETLRSVDDRPFCLISHFLPLSRLRGIEQGYAGGSLHAFLEAAYALQLRRESSVISAIQPRGDDARLLQVSRLQPVLRAKTVNVDARSGNPVEYGLTRFRGDRVQLKVEF
ncbi:MAG TPA: phosphonate metabolism transcriptional regulator PhnF [Roseomonas sp.]|jgi:GntR family phosphonate transport system transcriptional regulator